MYATVTYIESALYDFTKSIFTRGLRTLYSPRYFPYSLVLIIIVVLSTGASILTNVFPGFVLSDSTIDIMLYLEVSAALAFILVGILLGRTPSKIQLPVILLIIASVTFILYSDFLPDSSLISLYLAGSFYILWIGIITFSTFSLFRDLFGNELFGTILFLGKQDDDGNPLFSVIGGMASVINFSMGYLLLSRAGDSAPIRFTAILIMALAVIAVLPLFGIQRKHDVFYTIMNAFYMFTTIRVLLLVFRVLTATTGDSSLWDTIFSMFMALYAVQGAAVRGVKIGKKVENMTVEEKIMDETEELGFSSLIGRLVTDRGIVITILGVLLGYHAMQVQTSLGRDNIFSSLELFSGSDIVILGYQVNIVISAFIFIISFLLFVLVPKYRIYANPEVKRIPWAPEYNELKVMVVGIKSGDVAWKIDTAKLIAGLASDKLRSKLGMGKRSENRIAGTFNKWMRKSKK